MKPAPQTAKRPAFTPADRTSAERVAPARSTARPLATRSGNPSIVQRTPAERRGLIRSDGQPGRHALVRPADRLAAISRPARVDPVAQKNWGNWGKWSGRAGDRTLNSAVINSNFRNSVNWSCRPAYWGSNPWWTAGACHSSWHHGHWHYGWNPHWYHHDHCHWYWPHVYPGYYYHYSPIAWGLACWGLGSLIYDTGYYAYQNPYPTEPYYYEDTTIRYEQPMSVIARDYPSGDEIASDLAASQSAAALERSRDAFRNEDYLTALKDVDEAISYQPGDATLHEYRALVLFALAKYPDAAGVLHSVLASGPGWDRQTMIGLYRSEDSYLAQLGKLEQYVAATPDQAAPRFLLGYHYLVGSELERSVTEFGEVMRLKPADTLARQLRDLAKSSVKQAPGEVPPPPGPGDAGEPAGEALTPAQLVGTWRSDRAENGTVTLSLREDAGFTWNFKKGDATPTDLTGTWEIDARGLLVLSTDDAQMVGEVKLPTEQKMTFILAGGPEGDPGLTFDRVP